jgi:hypothetical protein
VEEKKENIRPGENQGSPFYEKPITATPEDDSGHTADIEQMKEEEDAVCPATLVSQIRDEWRKEIHRLQLNGRKRKESP